MIQVFILPTQLYRCARYLAWRCVTPVWGVPTVLHEKTRSPLAYSYLLTGCRSLFRRSILHSLLYVPLFTFSTLPSRCCSPSNSHHIKAISLSMTIPHLHHRPPLISPRRSPQQGLHSHLFLPPTSLSHHYHHRRRQYSRCRHPIVACLHRQPWHCNNLHSNLFQLDSHL